MSARRRFGVFNRFARRKEGATAVEFAMIAPWFFMTLIGILEIALMSFAQTNLDFAVSETARRIRTGQVQAANMNATQIKAEVCNNLSRTMPMSCADLFVDVDQFVNFNAANNPSPVVGGAVDQTQIGYTPTIGGQVVLVRGYYQWQFITPMFQPILGDLSNGKRLLVSSTLFRNEPF